MGNRMSYTEIMIVQDPETGVIKDHKSQQIYDHEHVVGEIRSQVAWEPGSDGSEGDRVLAVIAIPDGHDATGVIVVTNIRTDLPVL